MLVGGIESERDVLIHAVTLRPVLLLTSDHAALQGIGGVGSHNTDAALVGSDRVAAALIQRPAGFGFIEPAVGIVGQHGVGGFGADAVGLGFVYRSGMLFITLPSGRRLAYVKPRIGTNKFGGESVPYMGIDAQKKWSRIESYGPKFVENIVQAVSRDILAYAMRTLSHCFICGHVHDELIIECDPSVSLEAVCEQMGRTPPWLPGIELRADGHECAFYQKQ